MTQELKKFKSGAAMGSVRSSVSGGVTGALTLRAAAGAAGVGDSGSNARRQSTIRGTSWNSRLRWRSFVIFVFSSSGPRSTGT